MQEYIDCSFEIELPKEDRTEEERRIHAQNMLIFYQQRATRNEKKNKSLKNQERERQDDEGSNDRDATEADLSSCQGKSFRDEDSLMILEGLSLGKSLAQIYKENKAIHYYPKDKLKNVAQCILLRLSKIMIDLLPIQPAPTPKQLKEKYFENNEVLRYYHCNDLNLCSTFNDLLFIDNWQRKNKEYLMRGYSHDYLPEDIKQRLAPITSFFNQLKEIHSQYQIFLQFKQKRKGNLYSYSKLKAKATTATILQSSLQQ